VDSFVGWSWQALIVSITRSIFMKREPLTSTLPNEGNICWTLACNVSMFEQ
jgi:hypothetical protein